MSVVTDLGINWAIFIDSEREIIEQAINRGHYEHLASIITQLNPEKVEEIEKIQKQLRPREFTFESQQQKRFEEWLSLNGNSVALLTPELEAEWQAKIDAEKQERLNMLTGGVMETESKSVDGTMTTAAITSNLLAQVKGLGEASIDKLRAANINTVDELRALPQEKRKEILGPLVAAKIKSLI